MVKCANVDMLQCDDQQGKDIYEVKQDIPPDNQLHNTAICDILSFTCLSQPQHIAFFTAES